MIERAACFTAGAFILLAAAHVLIIHSGGYGTPSAILTMAIAAGVICTALIVGAAWAAERRALAVLLAVFVVAGEAYGLLGTAERLVAQREGAQAPARAAQTAFEKASLRVTAAETARGAVTPTSDRLTSALGAKSAADAAVVEQAAERSCAVNCRALLQAQVDSASIEIEAARREIADRIQHADVELATARAEFATMEAPRSPSPFADRVGLPAWLVDVIVAALGALGANGLGIGLIAYAAHGRRHVDFLRLQVGNENRHEGFMDPESPEKVTAPPAPAIPDAEHAAQFAVETLKPAPEEAADLMAVFRAYVTWCRARELTPLSEAKFGAALATVFDRAGVPIEEKGGRIMALGIVITSETRLIAAA